MDRLLLQVRLETSAARSSELSRSGAWTLLRPGCVAQNLRLRVELTVVAGDDAWLTLLATSHPAQNRLVFLKSQGCFPDAPRALTAGAEEPGKDSYCSEQLSPQILA